MNDAEKHCQTKIDVQMYQIGQLFDSCNDEKIRKIISTIIDDAVANEEEVPMTIGDISSLFVELTDDQRLELIKSIIWTSEDMFKFHKKAEKMIRSNDFQETLD